MKRGVTHVWDVMLLCAIGIGLGMGTSVLAQSTKPLPHRAEPQKKSTKNPNAAKHVAVVTTRPVLPKPTKPTKPTKPMVPTKLTVPTVVGPTQRVTLALLRFRQLREVIQMLEWAVERGWLENLDVAQLKQIDQWLNGRLASLLGIQWQKGLWLHVQGTNQPIQPQTSWPPWLPSSYIRTWGHALNKLQQMDVMLQIPIKKTFWLGFAIQQILGLARVPFHSSTYNNTQSYWLFPPQGIPAILILGQQHIFVRLLWPHAAIYSEAGRRMIWQNVLVPSLVKVGQGFVQAQTRIRTVLSKESTVAFYLAVADTLFWLQTFPSRRLRFLHEQFAHVEGLGWEGTLTLSAFSVKTIEWYRKRKPLQMTTQVFPTLARMQRRAVVQPIKLAPTPNKPKIRELAQPAPQGLPLPNPLWRRVQPVPPLQQPKRDPFARVVAQKRNHLAAGDKKAPLSEFGLQAARTLWLSMTSQQSVSPLPLEFVTWPSDRSVFFGSFSQSKTPIQPQSVLIRRLFRPDRLEDQQPDVLARLLTQISQAWSSSEKYDSLWLEPRQVALWILESMMFQEWMLWGELESKPQPSHSPTLGAVKIAAVGRWSTSSRSWLLPLLRRIATQVTKSSRHTQLHFSTGSQRTPLLLTWRDDVWFLSDSTSLLESMVRRYQRQERGPFLNKLVTDSMVYLLQKNRQWNVLHLNPALLQCLLQRSFVGQVASLFTQKVETVEIATLPQTQTYEIHLKVRWNPDKSVAPPGICQPPARTWKHLLPFILSPFQHAFLWQFLEQGNRLLPPSTRISGDSGMLFRK